MQKLRQGMIGTGLLFVLGVLWVAVAKGQSAQQRPVVGQVVDAWSGDGVAGAVVEVQRGGSQGRIRSVIADGQGRFGFLVDAVDGILIRASKPGFAGGHYGQLSPTSPPIAVDLSGGESTVVLTLRLWKDAVLTGVVLDSFGEPVVDAPVVALKLVYPSGYPTLVSTGRTTTDDRGIYRLAGLVAGTYVGALGIAKERPVTSDREPSGDSGQRPTTVVGQGRGGQGRLLSPLPGSPAPSAFAEFYPRATSPGTAELIRLRSGEVRAGIDFRQGSEAGAVIRGRVVGVESTEGLVVRLQAANDMFAFDLASVEADENGEFSFRGVQPGAYSVRTSVLPGWSRSAGTQSLMGLRLPSRSASATEERALWAEATVMTEAGSVSYVDVVLQAGARLAGRIEFDSHVAPPTGRDLERAVVLVGVLGGWQLGSLPLATLDAAGTFRTVGLPAGRYFLTIQTIRGRPWFTESTYRAGREVVDGLLDVGASDVGDLVVRVTTGSAELRGSVSDASGEAASYATVYLFSTNRAHWNMPGAHKMLATAAGSEGEYAATTLSPGEYFVVATTRLVDDWRQPDTLGELATRAVRVRLSRDNLVVKDLKVVRW